MIVAKFRKAMKVKINTLLRTSVVFFSFLVLLTPPVPARAAGTTATVSWTVPTRYASGEALPAADIAFYTISWSRSVSAITGGTITVNAPATTTPVTGFPCGTEVFIVTFTTTAQALHPNSTSDPSISNRYDTGIACTQNPNPVNSLTAV